MCQKVGIDRPICIYLRPYMTIFYMVLLSNVLKGRYRPPYMYILTTLHDYILYGATLKCAKR